MIDICLLGSGGMMPLPYRYLTSLMVRYNGKSILIDCGEGTQMALRRKGWSPKPAGTAPYYGQCGKDNAPSDRRP